MSSDVRKAYRLLSLFALLSFLARGAILSPIAGMGYALLGFRPAYLIMAGVAAVGWIAALSPFVPTSRSPCPAPALT